MKQNPLEHVNMHPIDITIDCRKMLTIAFDSNKNDVAVLKNKIPD